MELTEDRDEGVFLPYDREGTWSGAAAGAVMGFFGGLAMLAVMMFFHYATNQGAFESLRLIGNVGNARALEDSTSFVLFGLLFHLAIATNLGALFGALCGRNGTTGGALAFGLLYGLCICIAMSYWVLPMVNPLMYRAIDGFTITWIAAHACYGFILGFAPICAISLRRRYAEYRFRHENAYRALPREQQL